MQPDYPKDCPIIDGDERRKPEVRLDDVTIAHLEMRISQAVQKTLDGMIGDELVVDAFAKRLFQKFVDKLAEEASKVARDGIFAFIRLGFMALVWCSVGYTLFGWAGVTESFKAIFAR